jgi:hypothetical protein
MNDTALKNIAKKILKQANIPENEMFGSVIAILMIISIILTLVRVLQECNKNKLSGNYTEEDKRNLYASEIKEYSIRRGWFTKMRIKKLLRRELNKEQYEKHSIPLMVAILDTGEKLHNEEVSCLLEAANV